MRSLNLNTVLGDRFHLRPPPNVLEPRWPAAKEGFADRMHFQVSNTHKLVASGGEFDAVVLHTP
jgi:hypothetical protein